MLARLLPDTRANCQRAKHGATFFQSDQNWRSEGATGDTTTATASYREAVAIARRLAAFDPSNPSLRLDLAQGFCKIGDVTLGDADKDARVAYYEEGLEIMRGLVRRDPRNCLATGSLDEPEQGWRCQAA